jgi:hypothetical protein
MTQLSTANRTDSLKLRMMYTLASESMSELNEILRDRSQWVEDPDDCCSIGFTHKDDLAQVKWGFDRILDTLSAIEDATWDRQGCDVVPPALLAHLEQSTASECSSWLDKWTVTCINHVHAAVLHVANSPFPCHESSQPPREHFGMLGKEHLMYALCSDALLGIYTLMEESVGWDHGLHHEEIMEVLCCLDSTKDLIEVLNTRTWEPTISVLAGLLRDLARPIFIDKLQDCSKDAIAVIQSAFFAVVDVVAVQHPSNPR